MDDVEIDGTWWLPESPERKAPGRLRLTDNTADLEVDPRALTGHMLGVDADQPSLPIIVGELEQSPLSRRHVSLFTADVRRAGLGTVRLQPDMVLFGYSMVDSDAFSELRVSFDWLLAWLAPKHLLDDVDVFETNRLSMQVGDHESCSTRLDGADVWFGAGTSFHTDAYEVEAQREAQIRLTFEEPIGWREAYERWLRPLQDMLVVMLGVPVQLTTTYLRPVEARRREGFGEAVVPWLKRDPARHPTEANLISWPSPVILTGQEFAAQCSTLLPGWFAVAQRFEQTVIRLTAPSYAQSIYLDNECALIAQAMESASLELFGARDRSRTAHKQRVAAVMTALNEAAPSLAPEDLEWAQGVLQSRNDKSFTRRIAELIDDIGPLGSTVLEIRADAADALANLRHSVSHAGVQNSQDDDSYKIAVRRKYFLKELAIWILRVVLLQRAGLKDAAVLAAGNDHLQQTLQMLAGTYPPSDAS